MLVAIVAIIVALSSTATAAIMITGANIKDGSITGKDIKKNSLTSKHIKNGSLTVRDLKASAVAQLKGATGQPGPVGSAGATGPAGAAGPEGINGVSGLELIAGPDKVVAAGASTISATACTSPKRLLSANAYWLSSNNPVQLVMTPNSATAYATNSTSQSDTLKVQVICAIAN